MKKRRVFPLWHKLLDHDGFAWLVLLIMLIVTMFLWQSSAHQIERRTHERFLFLANKEGTGIVNRMQAYEQILRGAAALFAASNNVSRDEWRAYIKPLEVSSSMPGILGTGFAIAIPPEERTKHEQAVRAEGFPDYQITPSTELDLTTSIIYLEPFDQRNRRAFGYDMYSEPVRRAAMARARDSGKAALSSKVTLLQEMDTDVQPGFLMYVPVYQNGIIHENVMSRRAALQGFVYSPFRARDLMDGILQEPNRDLELELFDGKPQADNLLYSAKTNTQPARYMTDITLQIASRAWTARVHSSEAFENNVVSTQPVLILTAGVGLDFALFAMFLGNARHRRKMSATKAALEQSRDSFRTLVENVPGTVFRSEVASPWRTEHISLGIESLVGEPAERFLTGEINLGQFIHPDDIDMVVEVIEMAVAERDTYSIEYRMYTSAHCIRWVTERGRASYDATGQPQWLDGVILDVTDRKVAELAIRDLAFFDPLTGLPNRRLLIDRLTQQIALTSRSKRYDALLFIDMDDFKSINDSLGHDVGDSLLVEISRRMLSNVRESDTVTRFGGDEFVLMLDDLADNKVDAKMLAQQVGEKLLSALNQPYHLGGELLHNSPSIGITIFSGHEATVDELLRRADKAMYRAKSAGRNRFMVYESDGAA